MSTEGHTDPGWCEDEAATIIREVGGTLTSPLDSPTPNRNNMIWLAERLKAKMDKLADSYAGWRG